MKEQFGTALGLAIGTLVYDAIRGQLGTGSLQRAAVAFLLSFALLSVLAAFRRQRQPPRD